MMPAMHGAGVDSLTGNLLGGLTQTAPQATAAPMAVADLADVQNLLPGSITGDHGIVDVNGHHII